MELRRGIAVSPGVAIGPALVLGSEGFRIPRRLVRDDAADTEIARFRGVLREVCEEITANVKLASDRMGAQYAAIFSAHLQMAQDPKLAREVEDLIREHSYSPEFASSKVLRKYAKTLQSLGDRYMAERAVDLYDLEKRILRHLLGERREELAQLTEPVIVLAHNLTPSETANLDTRFVLGFATEAGGKSSHTAILAGALEIPAVVAVGDFLSDVSGGETIIIDGNYGVVIVAPDDETIAQYRDKAQRFHSASVKRESLGPLRSETQDNVPVHIYGNIEFPDEIEHCTQRGAEGIGLYRTEFLYLEGDREPSEEEHYQAYSQVVRQLAGKPVVIRTFDLGADKLSSAMEADVEDEPNPCLGLRSIRLTLQHLASFRTQLRAILRASAEEAGQVRVMFPLVSTLLEFRQARMVVADVMEDLEEEGILFNREVPVGMMVEVPSAALMAEEFAREVDFFSIGTNDLIQYTLAVDRSNPAVANLYSAADPSIFRMIRMVVEAGEKQQIPVSVCGQMSSDPIYIPLLVGMGLRELSVTPHAIPEVKQVIRSLTIPQAREIAQRVEGLEIARDVENFLRGELKKLCPDLVL